MNNIEKFRELLLTDVAFQKKLQAAVEAYTGEQTEKAVYNNILIPLAGEYNITATYDEFKDYMEKLSDAEMSKDELAQVAGGGKGQGAGVVGCFGVGMGVGGGGGDGAGAGCAMVGIGWGGAVCKGSGETATPF